MVWWEGQAPAPRTRHYRPRPPPLRFQHSPTFRPEHAMHGVCLRSVLVLATVATPAVAQNECLKDYQMPAVGRWAEYQATFKGKPSTMRYSVVGEESREGTPMKWLELRMAS